MNATPNKIARYIVLHEGVVAKFPWSVIDAATGEPALWQDDPNIGRVPLRYRTEQLAQAAADRLNRGET